MNPGLHAQVRDPGVLVQVAFTLHPPLLVRHSFTPHTHPCGAHVADRAGVAVVARGTVGCVGLEHIRLRGCMQPRGTGRWVQVTPTQWSTPTQSPPVQMSPTVFGLPSSHTERFDRTVPLHTPAVDVVHLSFCVHELPSSHAAPAFDRYTHRPVFGLHPLAVWHWFGAMQTTAGTPTHLPAWQASLFVQALPSLHAAPSGLFV